MYDHVKTLAQEAAQAANDNEGTTSMKLSQAALNLTNAMQNLKTMNLPIN